MAEKPRTLRAEAVVLRHSDWGEADRLLVLYTRELGKLRALAKGVKRLRSRKAGHIQPFSRVALLMARGHDLWIITQAEMLDSFQPLRDDLVLTAYAAYVVELLDRFSYEEGENQAVYRLLIQTLQLLVSPEDAYQVVRYYEIRLLDLSGFRPQLFQCVRCGEEIRAQDQYFSAELGGALCPRCGAGGSARPISMPVLRYIRHLQRSSYTEACRARLDSAHQLEAEALMQYYLTHLLERGLNAPSFLREVRKNELP
jgi:DNA repair protein RecO (recombination protein O)